MSKEVVKDEYITDDFKRKLSFKKRKAGIIKKARELSILCGVEAGAIIFSGDPSDPEPEVWPDHEAVQQIIEKCRVRPNTQRTLNREESLQARINKGKELLMRRRQENHVEEISQQLIQCMEGKTLPTLTNWLDMKMLVEQNLKNINWKVQESGKVEFSVPPSSMTEKLQVFRENEMLTGQFQYFNMDVPTPPTLSEGLCIHKETDQYGAHQMLQPTSSANPYIPTSSISERLAFNVQNENLTDQNLQCGMDMGTLEHYMGFGAYEMPQPSNNANHPYVPSFYNPFSP